jgi:hypothetical protein
MAALIAIRMSAHLLRCRSQNDSSGVGWVRGNAGANHDGNAQTLTLRSKRRCCEKSQQRRFVRALCPGCHRPGVAVARQPSNRTMYRKGSGGLILSAAERGTRRPMPQPCLPGSDRHYPPQIPELVLVPQEGFEPPTPSLRRKWYGIACPDMSKSYTIVKELIIIIYCQMSGFV